MYEVKASAIILAAGKGSRMNSSIPKQYLMLNHKPVLYYSIKVFEDSGVNDIVLVVGKGEKDYCKREIVDKYGFQKVKVITEGGKERSDSVFNGLCSLTETDYVFIHDGARPFLTQGIIRSAMENVIKTKACVIGMPVKDTIKLVDKNNYVTGTPDRNSVWITQTPQVFEYSLIKEAYSLFMQKESLVATDDAMVLEQMLKYPVQLVKGSYENIKITTPEDIVVAEAFLTDRETNSM